MKIKEVCKCGAILEVEDNHELIIEERQDIIEKKYIDWIKRHHNCRHQDCPETITKTETVDNRPTDPFFMDWR